MKIPRVLGGVLRLGSKVLIGSCACLLLLLPLATLSVVKAQFSWEIQVVDAGAPASGATSLTLDSRGRPHIAFADGADGRLKYARWNGETWDIDSPPLGEFIYGMVSLALDARDLPHISYYLGQSGRVGYAHFNGVSWHVLAVDASHGAAHNSLALDDGGVPHISYVWFNGDLRLAQRQGLSWLIETVDSDVITARFPSLGISEGRPQIAYYGNGSLLHARRDSSGWGIEVVDQTESPQFISLALAANDRWSIGYRNERRTELLYATKRGTDWIREVVDATGDVGWDARLALDRAGNPHFSYYDKTLGVFKYAHKEADAWIVHVVDFGGIVGWWSDIAVGEDGRPHFSYYSWTDQSVKYAFGEVGLATRTWPARDLGSTSATLVAELNSLGDAEGALVYLEWRPAGEDWSAIGGSNLSAPGFVEVKLEGLSPETSYEYRAVASVDRVMVYGETLHLRTQASPSTPLVPEVVVFVAVGIVLGLLALYLLSVWNKRRVQGTDAKGGLGTRTETSGNQKTRERDL